MRRTFTLQADLAELKPLAQAVADRDMAIKGGLQLQGIRYEVNLVLTVCAVFNTMAWHPHLNPAQDTHSKPHIENKYTFCTTCGPYIKIQRTHPNYLTKAEQPSTFSVNVTRTIHQTSHQGCHIFDAMHTYYNCQTYTSTCPLSSGSASSCYLTAHQKYHAHKPQKPTPVQMSANPNLPEELHNQWWFTIFEWCLACMRICYVV